MLYGLLLSLYIFNCLLLIVVILIQQAKGSMGLGAMGGGQQILFGGSGGQELFQKATWVLGTIFLLGSLALAIMKSTNLQTSRYLGKQPVAQLPVKPNPATEVDGLADILGEEPAQ